MNYDVIFAPITKMRNVCTLIIVVFLSSPTQMYCDNKSAI